MSAQPDKTAAVYYCVVCGPILRLAYGKETITLHHSVPHPPCMANTDEANPQ